MRTLEQKLKDAQGRIDIINLWSDRVVKLPMSEQAFCKKYGISLPRFNSIKNGRSEYIPSKKYIDRIEWCLENEDV